MIHWISGESILFVKGIKRGSKIQYDRRMCHVSLWSVLNLMLEDQSLNLKASMLRKILGYNLMFEVQYSQSKAWRSMLRVQKIFWTFIKIILHTQEPYVLKA